MTLTAEFLRSIVRYQPEDGNFLRLVTVSSSAPAGSYAGTVNGHGYRQTCIKSIIYRNARLAFLYMTGDWPKGEVDHINCIRADDRWINLREATRSQNAINRISFRPNKFGLRGVGFHAHRNKFVALVTIGGKIRQVGSFDTPAAAHEAYLEAAHKHHGNFARLP